MISIRSLPSLRNVAAGFMDFAGGIIRIGNPAHRSKRPKRRIRSSERVMARRQLSSWWRPTEASMRHGHAKSRNQLQGAFSLPLMALSRPKELHSVRTSRPAQLLSALITFQLKAPRLPPASLSMCLFGSTPTSSRWTCKGSGTVPFLTFPLSRYGYENVASWTAGAPE